MTFKILRAKDQTQLWQREELIWAAGLLEGEGSFHVTHSVVKGKKYYRIRISCDMRDEDVIEKLKEVLRFGSIRRYFRKNGYVYKYQVNTRDEVYALCCALYPFMGKRRQGQIRKVISRWRNLKALAVERGWG